MKILDAIIDEAVREDVPVSALLRKCKVLAAQLGIEQLENWLLAESNGYAEKEEVPGYRKWHLELFGDFSGPWGSGIQNAPIPQVCIPEAIREAVTNQECRDSVSKLESLLGEKDTSGTLIVTRHGLAVELGQNVYQGQKCIHCWARLPKGNLVEALNSVRNRILDFCLAIQKQFPSLDDSPGMMSVPSKDSVVQIFNNTVMGGSVGVMGAAAHSSVVVANNAGDFNSLARLLDQNGVSKDDIDGLSAAISEEPNIENPEQFGPRVAGWIGGMVQKAASGMWDVGIGSAGSLLASAIRKYYGLP